MENSFYKNNSIKYNIVIVGLGYVGLPLAIEFGKKFNTIGFDINLKRISDLKNHIDETLEIENKDFEASKFLNFCNELIIDSNINNIFIVTVPTPIDKFKKPDLKPLIGASTTIGKLLKKGDIVIYESTVYPGCTEEDCVPLLEKESNLSFNHDFYCGYSPERINPGDKKNTLTKIKKITSGSTPEAALIVNDLYNQIIVAGTYMAPTIKVAEAAKIVENCQRDVNISFVNELALIFDKMNIDTNEVLNAAATKWNFLNFKPGLVGGHCIGVDPYYMIHKAESLGYYPALIGAGRKINDNMGIFVANKAIKLMISKGISIKGSKALILGFTFKENCPDIRNTKVIDIYNELNEFGIDTDIYDPWANIEDVEKEYKVSLIKQLNKKYDLIVLAVSHSEYLDLDFNQLRNEESIFFDIKSLDLNFQPDSRL